MKLNKIIGISAMAILLATLMVSGASAAGGSSYATAQSITVPDRTLTYFGTYTAGTQDWWKFNANVYDNIYIDLNGVFTQNGGKEYLHDPYQGVIKAQIVCYRCSQNDNYGQLAGTQPRLQITRGTSSTYDHMVGRNW